MIKLLLISISVFFFYSCDNNHFITDSGVRNKVKIQFKKTEDLAKNRSHQLFDVFDEDLSLAEKEALQFLYAYMPLSDLADYDGHFYLMNVRASLAARDTFSWGKTVPEDLFRHFVLPIRVNNENLDSSRIVFFEELKERVRNMTMKEAVLEINHWCHEKVTYKGTDSRTSSPLATVKTAYGRCGEESTFTVAAMRAAGIPARQCYTPRWAHTDDNHAWVEVWVDSKWSYLGACEPEHELNLGWFSAPAKRAMLVSTNVFGDYSGPEDVLLKDERFTRINVLPNYTDTKRIYVKVTDTSGNTVDSAAVEFQLYNYAEFFPLLRTFTDKNGLCSFITGFGDLIVWSSKSDLFSYKKIHIQDTDTLKLILSMSPGKEYSEEFDLVPPVEKKVEANLNDSLKQINLKRFSFEDQIRGNYEKTFIDSAKSFRLAETIGVNADSLWDVLFRSRGNYREIIEFITSVADPKRYLVFPLLNIISEKDLHDINTEVLFDQINAAGRIPGELNGMDMFLKYVLNPRIDNEYLKPYQTMIQNSFEEDFISRAQKDPKEIVNWINNNLTIDRKTNYGKAPLSPVGVFELKITDPPSRDIFFVAVCRSFSIPSRIEPSTRLPQYFIKGRWVDVNFEKVEGESPERGIIMLNSDRAEQEIKPEYYIHFTIESFKEGFYRSLDYENDPSVNIFPSRLEVIPGNYLIVTGNRVSNGTVLAKLDFINIEAGKQRNIILQVRKKTSEQSVEIVTDASVFVKKAISKDETPGTDGTIVAWIESEKEPSRHFISDLIRKKDAFQSWNGKIFLLFSSENEKRLFTEKNRGQLPVNSSNFIVARSSLTVYEDLAGIKLTELPVVIFIDKSGKIKYSASGYRIGAGDDLIRLIK